MADEKETDAAQESTPEETATQQQATPEPRLRWRRRSEPEPPHEGRDEAGAFTDAQQKLVDQLIQERVAAEQTRAEEAQARLLRAQADFSNYKRRSEQEREGQAKFASLVLITELLPILDNFDRALATMPDEVRSLPWTDGLLLVDRQLRATLDKQGLKPIEAVGNKFDPTLHEAIIHEESADHADDEVIAELQRGYMLHDRVVRPTLVKVAKNAAHA